MSYYCTVGCQTTRFLTRPYFLVVLIGIFFAVSAFFPAGIAADNSEPPADFKLFLQSDAMMRHPDFPPESLTLSADGKVQFSSKGTQNGKLEPISIQIDANAVREIFKQVQTQDFFSLKKEYVDPDVLDGDYAVMTITANNQKHTVRTVNIAVEAFDAIVNRVNRFMPPERNIYYNALYDTSYKRVKR